MTIAAGETGKLPGILLQDGFANETTNSSSLTAQ